MKNYKSFILEKRNHINKIKKFCKIPEIYNWAHEKDPNLSIWLANELIKKFRKSIQSYSNTLVSFEKMLKGETVNEPEKKFILQNIESLQNLIDRDVTKILHYVNSPIHVNRPNIRNLSFDEAKKLSDEWHDKIEITGFPIEEEHGEIILTFDDGFYWIDLETTKDEDEAKSMGHCGTTNAGTTILSLRREKHPYVTVAYDEVIDIFTQCKGRGNKSPISRYHPYIVDLICHLNVKGLKSEYDRTTDLDVEDLSPELYDKLKECNPDYIEGQKRKSLEELEYEYREYLYYNWEEEIQYNNIELMDYIDDEAFLDSIKDGEIDAYKDSPGSYFKTSDMIEHIKSNINDVEDLDYDKSLFDDGDEYLDSLGDNELIELMEKLDIDDEFFDDYFNRQYRYAEDYFLNVWGRDYMKDINMNWIRQYINEEELINSLVSSIDEYELRERFE